MTKSSLTRKQAMIFFLFTIINIKIASEHLVFYYQLFKYKDQAYSMVRSNFIIFVILLLLLCLTFQLSHTQSSQSSNRRHRIQTATIPKQRTDTLNQRCSVPRNQFYASQYNDSKSAARQLTANQIHMDGDAIIYKFLSNDTEGAKQEFYNNSGGVVVYFIFIVLGLLVMILLCPILLCCIFRPNSCPPCLKCRQDPNIHYTNCQKKWPVVVIVVLSLLLIGIMIAGTIQQITQFQQKIQPYSRHTDTRCSVSMNFDDMLNGNYTQDGKQYFIGLKPLRISLQAVKQKLQGFVNIFKHQSSSDKNNFMDQITHKLADVKHELNDIPLGDGSQRQLHLQYATPINSYEGHHFDKIQSKFNQVIGSKHAKNSIIGTLYHHLSKAQHELDLGAGNIISKLSQTIQQGFQKFIGVITTVQDIDKDIDGKLQAGQDKAINPIYIVTIVVAALSILSAVLLIVGSIFVCFFQKYQFRKLLYFGCVSIGILGVLCFVLALAMSAITLGTHYGCNYIQEALITKKQFVYRFMPVIKNQLLTQIVAQCATKQGTGQLLTQQLIGKILNQANSSSLPIVPNSTNLVNLTPTTHLYQKLQNSNEQSHQQIQKLLHTLNEAKMHLHSQIQKYHSFTAIDIDSPLDLQIISKLSHPAQYTCSSPGFTEDSWMPSPYQTIAGTPCQVQSQQLPATSQTCKTQEDFIKRAVGCRGCVDTSSIFSRYKSRDQVLQALKRRYPSSDCSVFNEQLANVWNNFYRVREQALSKAEQRAKQVQNKIGQIHSLIKQNLEESRQHKVAHGQDMGSIVSSLDQKSKKLNCKVLGQDMQLATNTFCRQVFNYSYIMRVFFIIASFAMLLLVIFSTMLAIRIYKISEQENNNISYKYQVENSKIRNSLKYHN